MYLSDFGIGTLSYFDAEEGERKAYHIDGDPDDENTSSNEDKLKAAIASDPDKVISFFTQLCDKMYNDIGTVMKRSEYRSVYKIYDDKQLQSDYDDYNTKIANAQKKLEEYEDKWYAKFSDMEVALSKIQSNSNSITNMLGN
jgi:flagellar hook-associated protein 2